MTPREMLDAVERVGVDADIRKELQAVLETSENARYAATSDEGVAGADLLRRARDLVNPLDRIRPETGSTNPAEDRT